LIIENEIMYRMNYFIEFTGLSIMRRFAAGTGLRAGARSAPTNATVAVERFFTGFTGFAGLTGLSLSLTRGLNPVLSSIMRRFAVGAGLAPALNEDDTRANTGARAGAKPVSTVADFRAGFPNEGNRRCVSNVINVLQFQCMMYKIC
jgi:hypothetical protein